VRPLSEAERTLTVDFNEEGLDDIVSDHLEVGVTDPVRDLGISAWTTRYATSLFNLKGIVTHSGPGTSEEVVKDSDLVTEQHQSVNQVRTNETSTTGNCTKLALSPQYWTETDNRHTEDPLSLGIGQELDRWELSDGSVLDRVGFLVVDRLGSKIFLFRTNVDGLSTGLDVAGGLSNESA
jgi:hypothetical protein